MSTAQHHTDATDFTKQLQQLTYQKPSYAARCKRIVAHLLAGTHYRELGGKYLRCKPGVVRFKLGQRYRLLVRKDTSGWTPVSVISHESYNNVLKRRR